MGNGNDFRISKYKLTMKFERYISYSEWKLDHSIIYHICIIVCSQVNFNLIWIEKEGSIGVVVVVVNSRIEPWGRKIKAKKESCLTQVGIFYSCTFPRLTTRQGPYKEVK